MQTKREIGDKLEEYVLVKVKEIDPNARLYTNCKQKDIQCNFAYGECKKRNTKDFTIKESVWLHLNNNLPINTKKYCFMVHENVNGRKLVTLDCDEFFRILVELKYAEQEKG